MKNIVIDIIVNWIKYLIFCLFEERNFFKYLWFYFKYFVYWIEIVIDIFCVEYRKEMVIYFKKMISFY